MAPSHGGAHASAPQRHLSSSACSPFRIKKKYKLPIIQISVVLKERRLLANLNIYFLNIF
jgi:hypothetical protein